MCACVCVCVCVYVCVCMCVCVCVRACVSVCVLTHSNKAVSHRQVIRTFHHAYKLKKKKTGHVCFLSFIQTHKEYENYLYIRLYALPIYVHYTRTYTSLPTNLSFYLFNYTCVCACTKMNLFIKICVCLCVCVCVRVCVPRS